MYNRKGFTLIELLVVISIIAILAVIVFTQVQGLTARARNSTTQTTVNEAGNAINLFRQDDTAADRVILFAKTGDSSQTLNAVSGDAAWGPFTGKTVSTASTSGTFAAATELQYPVRISRVTDATHFMTYAVYDATPTAQVSSTNNRAYYTLPTNGCVLVTGTLVNDASGNVSAYYRNGISSVTSTAAASITCTAP